MCKALHDEGYIPYVYDDLSTGHNKFVQWGPLWPGSLMDKGRLERAIRKADPAAVIHLAAKSIAPMSITEPSNYYSSNVIGTLNLLDSMNCCGVDTIIFASSAAAEQPTNPYGATKLICETALADYGRAYGMKHISLRFFNAAGAHPDAMIGEWHNPETHLIPRLIHAAFTGEPFMIYGDKHLTIDGTAVRDYVHVCDLAEAHVKALKYLLNGTGYSGMFNIGTGAGHSVRQLVEVVHNVTGEVINFNYGPARPGDPAKLIADPTAAKLALGFRSVYDLNAIVETAVAWHHYQQRIAI